MAIRAKQLKAEKEAAVADVKGCFEATKDFVFTEYRGLTVAQITDLRAKLRERQCAYRVVKNNFARIALNEMDKGGLAEYFTGPTAVAFYSGDDEANSAVKVLFDFAKETPALVIKGGFIGGEVYDAEKLEAYSKLPGKKDLIAMLMSAMQATTSKLARTLQAVADKKGEEASA